MVECLRLSGPTLLTLLRGESPEPNQPRFVRVQFQFEFGKTFPQCCQKSFCIAFVLEAHHTVVGVAYEDDIANSMSLAPLLRP